MPADVDASDLRALVDLLRSLKGRAAVTRVGLFLMPLRVLECMNESLSEDGRPSVSYERFRQNLKGHEKCKESTFRKHVSYLSNHILQPACWHLSRQGRQKFRRGYVAIRRKPGQANAYLFEPVLRRYPKAFLRGFQGIRDRETGIEWIANTIHANLYKATGRLSRKAADEETSREGGEGISSAPIRSEAAGSHMPAILGAPSPHSTVYSGFKREIYQLTELTCVFQLPHGLSAAEAGDMLHPYQQLCRRVVERFGGHREPDRNGEVCAYFGYAGAAENHARSAVDAALCLRQRLGVMRPQRCVLPMPTFRIHSFSAEVTAESSGRGFQTIVGDSGPSAHALAEQTASGRILISADTFRWVRHFFECRLVSERQPHIHEVLNDRGIRTLFNSREAGACDFVGRKAEMDHLQEAWEAARHGRPRVVWIQGMIGIGKSRLVHEAVKRIGKTGTKVRLLTCQCRNHHMEAPFFPVGEMLREQLEIPPFQVLDRWAHGRLRAFVRGLHLSGDATFPVLRALLDDSIDLTSWRRTFGTLTRPMAERNLADSRTGDAYDVLRNLLMRMAEKEPVVLVVEDLHWADPDTRILLRRIVESAAGEEAKLLLLVTFRGRTDIHPPVETDRAMFIDLPSLGDEEAKELVASVRRQVASAPISDVTHGGGIPYLLFHHAMDPVHAEDGWRKKVLHECEGTGTLAEAALRPKHVAFMASVLGRNFLYGHLQAALLGTLEPPPASAWMLEDALGYLSAAGVIRKTDELSERRYEFASESILTAVRAGLAPAAREAAHGSIAELFRQAPSFNQLRTESPELLAEHYAAAGKKYRSDAIHWWRKGIKRFLEASEYRKTIDALERALELMPENPATPKERQQVLNFHLDAAVARTVVDGSGTAAVAEHYRRAEELLREDDKPSLLFRVQWGRWIMSYSNGRLAEAQQYANALVHIEAQAPDPHHHFEARHAVWDTSFHLGKMRTALAFHFDGLATSRRVFPKAHKRGYAGHAPNVCCLSRASLVLWFLGYLDQAIEIGKRAVDLADRTEHHHSRAHAHSHAALLHLLRRDFDAVRSEVKTIHEITGIYALEHRHIMAETLLNVADAWEKPSPATAEALENGVRGWQNTGMKLFDTFWLTALAECYVKMEQPAKAHSRLDEAEGVMIETKEHLYEPELHRIRAACWLAGSAPSRDKAAVALWTSVNTAYKLEMRPLELRALIDLCKLYQSNCRPTDRRQEALKLLKKVYRWFWQGHRERVLVEARGLLPEESTHLPHHAPN